MRPSLTEVPSLHRRYPASSVLRTSPPPHTARPVSRELPVDRCHDHRWGFPCCVWSPMRTCHRHYPGKFNGACSLVISIDCGLPSETVRSAPLQLFFRGLLSVHCTLWPARSRSRLGRKNCDTPLGTKDRSGQLEAADPGRLLTRVRRHKKQVQFLRLPTPVPKRTPNHSCPWPQPKFGTDSGRCATNTESSGPLRFTSGQGVPQAER